MSTFGASFKDEFTLALLRFLGTDFACSAEEAARAGRGPGDVVFIDWHDDVRCD